MSNVTEPKRRGNRPARGGVAVVVGVLLALAPGASAAQAQVTPTPEQLAGDAPQALAEGLSFLSELGTQLPAPGSIQFPVPSDPQGAIDQIGALINTATNIRWESTCNGATKTQVGSFLVPTPLDVCGNALPDVIATLGLTPTGVGLSVTKIPQIGQSTLPLKLEAVLPDPRAGSTKSIALGYDTTAASAPAYFSATGALLPGSPNVSLTLTSTLPGASLALIGEVFDRGAPGVRSGSTAVRLNYAPVPASSTIAVSLGADRETDPIRVSLSASSATTAVATVTDKTDPAVVNTITAGLEQLSGTLALTATGKSRIGYTATTRLNRITVSAATTPVGTTTPSKALALEMNNVPRTMDVETGLGSDGGATIAYAADDIADSIKVSQEKDDPTLGKRVRLNAEIVRIPARLDVAMSPPAVGNEPTTIAYTASTPADRLTVFTNAGKDRFSLDLSMVPVPTTMSVCAAKRAGCASPTRAMGANAGSVSVTTSQPTNVKLRDCAGAACGEHKIADITLRRFEFQANTDGLVLSALKGAAWFDTDDQELTGTADISGDQDIRARFPSGFSAQNRQLFWEARGIVLGDVLDRFGTINCPSGTQINVVRPVVTYQVDGVLCGRGIGSLFGL
jgi:hypothetical protein